VTWSSDVENNYEIKVDYLMWRRHKKLSFSQKSFDRTKVTSYYSKC
jgi:hypothetical protein